MAGLEKKIKDFAFEQGAHLVGIAGVQDFEAAPLGHKPADVLPGAHSVVVMGLKMLEGSFESENLRFYSAEARAAYDELNSLAFRTAAFIERQGFKAIMVGAFLPLDFGKGRRGFKADLSHKHAAVAAGLGKIGLNSLCVTPEYGPRARFVSVLTTADLEPDKKLQDDLCGDCMLCVDACPIGAISQDGKVDFPRCVRREFPYGMAAASDFMASLEGKEPEERARAWRSTDFFNLYQNVIASSMIVGCYQCVKACPVGHTLR